MVTQFKRAMTFAPRTPEGRSRNRERGRAGSRTLERRQSNEPVGEIAQHDQREGGEKGEAEAHEQGAVD
jgi:hypothetical protein